MTGPYIVTTKRPAHRHHSRSVHDQPAGMRVLSRRAVATLDKRELQRSLPHLADYGAGAAAIFAAFTTLPESGGTVGPLPDGTVIEVEATTWAWLADQARMTEWRIVAYYAEKGDPDSRQAILNAYNARQGTTTEAL